MVNGTFITMYREMRYNRFKHEVHEVQKAFYALQIFITFVTVVPLRQTQCEPWCLVGFEIYEAS